jgi:NADH-quinone oxidoreductase subunit G
VVLPVARVTDKAGTFVTWEGRPRPFEAVFSNPGSLPDLRVLAGIADELAALGQGSPLGFRTVPEVRAEMEAMGPWDGARHAPVLGKEPRRARARSGALALCTWKQLLDRGTMQDGDPHLAATRRPAVALVGPGTLAGLKDVPDGLVVLTGDRGSVTLPVQVADDMVDGVVWVPANSVGRGVLVDLASPGSTVTLRPASSLGSSGHATKGAGK